MTSMYDLFNYQKYSENFMKWRIETIEKLKIMKIEELYELEDQILRHKNFDYSKFNDMPAIGTLIEMCQAIAKPFLERPYKDSFYYQLNRLVDYEIKKRIHD